MKHDRRPWCPKLAKIIVYGNAALLHSMSLSDSKYAGMTDGSVSGLEK